jgi:hypothetical protein
MATERLVLGVFLALIGVVCLPAVSLAQTTSADTFDINRFSDAGNDWFHTFYPAEEGETLTLGEAIAQEKVTPDHRVLITQTADGRLALLTDQMAYHHIAEGTASNGVHWMATF